MIWGQIAITATQIMTHYSNDYFDLAADQANATPTRWSGGSRILVEGHIRAEVAWKTAVFFAGIALLAITILTLFVQANLWATSLLLLALFLAWEYSGPPLRLHSRGWGEVTVGLIVPLLTPLVGYTLQVGRSALLPLLAVLPLVCFQVGMILIINIPDAAGDQQAGKQTLVVRLGASRAMFLYVVLLGLAYMSLPFLVDAGLPLTVAWACLLPLPLAVWQGIRIGNGRWRQAAYWNSLGFWSITLLMSTAVCEAAAFLWLIHVGK
jgi:1,4-dihydroxy-2-naphthoate octaprenyltransferase